jgi:hypothetical protein
VFAFQRVSQRSSHRIVTTNRPAGENSTNFVPKATGTLRSGSQGRTNHATQKATSPAKAEVARFFMGLSEFPD